MTNFGETENADDAEVWTKIWVDLYTSDSIKTVAKHSPTRQMVTNL